MKDMPVSHLPCWVPENVRRYLEHIEDARSIRDLARRAGCHASTVSRQIRRVETRRDDPLVDAALTALATAHFPHIRACPDRHARSGASTKDIASMTDAAFSDANPDTATFEREAFRVLRRLCESGAVLAVAENMEKAVVVREGGPAETRTAVVDRAIAQAMALNHWIGCEKPSRISRYRITPAGRSALSHHMAAQENRVRAEAETGFADAAAAFRGPRGNLGEKTVDDPQTGRRRRVRYNSAESPLVALARRRDRKGQPFLDDGLVRAGERLREDFELAQMGPRVAQNWDRFLTGSERGGFAPDSGIGNGPAGARDRVTRALADLGPGLSDVALRCCCYLEGLETAEKRMGWSARSGKIVLRIALQRLKRHYDGLSAPERMIG